MSIKSEKSFWSRLENARKLKTNPLSFQNYQTAAGEFSIDDLTPPSNPLNPLIHK